MAWNIGYPNPDCGCGCATGHTCFVCSWPDTLTLATPRGDVTLTYGTPSNTTGWYGCAQQSLPGFVYPDPSYSAGNPYDYSYVSVFGLPASSGGGPNAVDFINVPVAYYVACAAGGCAPNRLLLKFTCPIMTRSVDLAGGAGPTTTLQLPIAGDCSDAPYSATQPTQSLISGCGYSASATMRDSARWVGGTGLGGAAAGTFAGGSACSDAGMTCSPIFSRWTSITALWGFLGRHTPGSGVCRNAGPVNQLIQTETFTLGP